MRYFQGLEIAALKNSKIELEYLVNAGPRIVKLSAFGKTNLFAELDKGVETPFGKYQFRGGHRLWHSPESIPRTYIPDDKDVTLRTADNSIQMTGPVEEGTGISKMIEIRLVPDEAKVELIHTLENHNLWQVEMAPWAITMCKLGGTAILPQRQGKVDEHGLLHNRNLSLWSYTKINDPRLILRDDFIFIKGNALLPPVKIGYFNSDGWIAYYCDGLLFKKSFDVDLTGNFPDGGCNAESYCNDEFIELESLGPMTRLMPGGSIRHREIWEFFDSLDVPFLSDEIREVLCNI